MCDEPSAFLGPTPPVLDQDTADRLLAGRLAAGEAPPGYAGVARLLAVATAPASREELAGEAAAVARFAATVRSHPATPRSHPHPPSPRLHPPTPIPQRMAMTRKLLSLKAAAVIIVAVVSVGGVAAAATGLLPGPARLMADQASSTSRAGLAGRGQAATVTRNGPGLDEATRKGLCQAWQAGQGTVKGSRADSAAFRALATAAGGADKVPAYCQAAAAAGATANSQGRATAANGPDAAGAARAGLCLAWQAGQGAASGSRADSAAFRALAAAAGGADKVLAYCQATPLGSASVRGQSPSADGSGAAPSAPPTSLPPPASVAPPASRPSPSDGQGDQGQGGPPTSTG
jgi:hypothetical protein